MPSGGLLRDAAALLLRMRAEGFGSEGPGPIQPGWRRQYVPILFLTILLTLAKTWASWLREGRAREAS